MSASYRGAPMRSKVSRMGGHFLRRMPKAPEKFKLEVEAHRTMMMELRNNIAIPCYIVLINQNDKII